MSKDEEVIAKIRKSLIKKDIHVVGKDTTSSTDRLLVVFQEKGKIKVGFLNTTFYARYGVKTFATFDPVTKRPWVQSNSSWDDISETLHFHIINESWKETYPQLDIDNDLVSIED